MEYFCESLDSSIKILRTEIGKFDAELFYLDMVPEYRIFVETDKKDNYICVGFERKLNDTWTITPITDDLSAKEVLGLFGTIKIIVKGRKFNGLLVNTDNPKKNQLYFNMLSKLNHDLKMIMVRDDKCILLYNGEYIPKFRDKFKYKKLV